MPCNFKFAYLNGLKIANGCDTSLEDIMEKLNALNMTGLMKDNLKDMDIVASGLVK